jgi:hypothetical protein
MTSVGQRPILGKRPFLERKAQSERKDSWKENIHVRGENARCTCKGDINTLGLGFLHDILMDDNPRLGISST